jgi:aspartate/methionine/tyrosine aminotransferase
VIDWCKTHAKTIILDCTFRFFVKQNYDQFQILIDSEVTFISIEDTGKVWPTQDLKASLIFYSLDIEATFNIIYEEIYLCVSNFQLELLREFLVDANQRGLEASVWREVRSRRTEFRKVIQNTILNIRPGSEDSAIGAEWVEIKEGYGTDIEILQSLKYKGLIALPGRHFYWNSLASQCPKNYLRFSLLKPRKQFSSSLNILEEELEYLRATCSSQKKRLPREGYAIHTQPAMQTH